MRCSSLFFPDFFFLFFPVFPPPFLNGRLLVLPRSGSYSHNEPGCALGTPLVSPLWSRWVKTYLFLQGKSWFSSFPPHGRRISGFRPLFSSMQNELMFQFFFFSPLPVLLGLRFFPVGTLPFSRSPVPCGDIVFVGTLSKNHICFFASVWHGAPSSALSRSFCRAQVILTQSLVSPVFLSFPFRKMPKARISGHGCTPPLGLSPPRREATVPFRPFPSLFRRPPCSPQMVGLL